jgi:hypothetical protein
MTETFEEFESSGFDEIILIKFLNASINDFHGPPDMDPLSSSIRM